MKNESIACDGADEVPVFTILRQLKVVKDMLIPFWGHGRTTMEFAPDDSGNVPIRYTYQSEDLRSFSGGFVATPEMAFCDADGSNPLLKHIANHFRGWMLGMPYDIRMFGGKMQYPTDAELTAMDTGAPYPTSPAQEMS